jgi:hypothetical protein
MKLVDGAFICRLAVIAIGAFFPLAPLGASTVTYTLTGQMDAYYTSTLCPTCASLIFDDNFTFEFVGATTGVFDLSPSGLANPALSSSFTIGAMTGSFDEALDVVIKGGTVGFVNTSLTEGVTLVNPGFLGYGLTTDIGPLGNTAAMLLGPPEVFQVSADDYLHVIKFSNLEFSAEVAPVPEPRFGGWVVMFAALAVFLGGRMRARRRLSD